MAKTSQLPVLPPENVDGTETLPVLKGGAMWRTLASAFFEKLAQPFITLMATQAATATAATASFTNAMDRNRAGATTLVSLFGSGQNTAAGLFTSIARGWLCGTDFPPGFIDMIRAALTAPTDAAYYTVGIYERLPTASLNAVPGSAGDLLVSSATITAAEFTAQGGFVIPRCMGVAGRYYIPFVNGFDAAGAPRAFGSGYYAGGAGAQWQLGWRKVSGAAWGNHNATRYISLGLARSDQLDAVKLAAQVRSARLSQMTSNYRAMIIRNEAALKNDCLFDPIGAGLIYRPSGDSLTWQSIGAPVRTSYDVTLKLSPGMVDSANLGKNGDTAGQILARVLADNAAFPARAAGMNICEASTNDEQTVAYDVTRANVDALIASFTGAWVFATGGSLANGVEDKQRRLFRELRAIHGAKIWDWETIWRQHLPSNTEDGLTFDGLHFASQGATFKGYEDTRLLRASYGGAPYVHEEVLPLRENDAAGTVLSNGLILGTVANCIRSAGDNSDGAVAIGKTGAITRGSGKITQGSREIIVKASNFRGGHEGRKTFLMAQDTGDTNPRYEVEFLGMDDGRQNPRLVPVDAANAILYPRIPNTTKLTLFIAMRVMPGGCSGSFDTATLLQTNSGLSSVRLFLKNTSGTSLAGSAVVRPAPDPYRSNGFFLSVDTDLGFAHFGFNEDITTVAIPADGIPISLALLTQLFMSTLAPLKGIALRRYMLITGTAFDISLTPTGAAKRALFYDPATGLPRNTGGSAIDGVTAAIDLYGREYDWLMGINRGSLGNLLPARWWGLERAGIREPIT
jgi:hypothetical protein